MKQNLTRNLILKNLFSIIKSWKKFYIDFSQFGEEKVIFNILQRISIKKKIDQYEDNMKYLITDQGREKIREIIRKEIKNSIDNKNIIKIEDRMIIRTFIDKIREELDY